VDLLTHLAGAPLDQPDALLQVGQAGDHRAVVVPRPDLARQLAHLRLPAGQVLIQPPLLRLQFRRAGLVVGAGLGEHLLPQGGVHDGGVLAIVDLVLVAHLAGVGHVGQQAVQARLGETLPAALLPRPRHPALVGPAPPLQLLDHRQQRLVL
jgi:hypothetical protein